VIRTVEVEFDDLQKLFDTAVNSMDFGSGFLDHDEVVVLRRFAGLLGVEKMTATPDNFRKQFNHHYRPQIRTVYDWTVLDHFERAKTKHDEEVCYWCSEKIDFERHR
jgi:hypothetical protein